MKINKKLVAMWTAKKLVTMWAAARLWISTNQASNLPDVIENTQQKVWKNIQHTPKKPQWNAKDLGELFNTSAKDKEKIDEIIKDRSGINDDIRDIKVDEKTRYITFSYKNKYNIKYEPKTKEGEPGMDIISIIDSVGKKEYNIQIGTSLFKKNLEQKNPKYETHKQKVTERLDFITNIFNIIVEKTLDESIILNSDEPIIIKGNKIYFAAERSIGKNEDFVDCFWKIDYQKAKTEWEVHIPEKYNITEIKDQDAYYENAYL